MRRNVVHQVVWFALLCATARADAKTIVSVEIPVQVSQANSTFIHDEVVVAADPAHSKRLLACSIVHRLGTRTVTNVAYTSNDAGRSWAQAFVLHGGIESYDPTCAFGPDGEAYVAGIQRLSLERFETKILLYRSDDGGKEWTEASQVGSTGPNDRPFVTVDQSPGKNRGAVYVAFTSAVSTAEGSSRAVFVFRSTDKGNTFVQMSSVIGGGDPATPGGIVRPDATFVTAMRRSTLTRTEILRRVAENSVVQPDGSTSLLEVGFPGSRVHKIADTYGCALERNGSLVPSFAADMASKIFRGRLYAVWPDSRSGRCEVLISHSEDEGKTWSTPFAVNDDAPRANGLGPDDARPAVAVNANGVVGVIWYDRRDSDDDRGWAARFSASLDGGETFLPSVRLSAAQTRFPPLGQTVMLTGETFGGGGDTSRDEGLSALLGYQTNHGLDGGDTSGLAADADGSFHPVWVDNSSGIFQLWTTTVHVSGDVIRNGRRELETLDDISRVATIVFDHVEFDRTSRLIIADVSVLNISNARLRGPSYLRVLRVLSPAGPLRLASTDSDDGHTALLDLTPKFPGGALDPNQQSDTRRIAIALPATGELDALFAIEHLLQNGAGSYRTGFVRLDVKLLGRLP